MPVTDWKTFKIYAEDLAIEEKIIRISYQKAHHFPASCVLCKFLRFIEKKKYIWLIPNPLSRKRRSTKSPHGLQYGGSQNHEAISEYPMKQHSRHHSIYICEVKLKILMQTHELLDRLQVWRNKLCEPCFFWLCCVFFFHFFSYLVWRFTSVRSGCEKQFTICVGLTYTDKTIN